MKSFCSISAPLLFLVLLGLSSANGVSIKEVCQIAGTESGYYEGEYNQFCEETLQSAAAGKEDDAVALTDALTKLVNKILNDNLQSIGELQKGKGLTTPYVESMDYCSRVYSHGLSKIEQAAACLAIKDFDGVTIYLSNARDQVVSCVDAESVAAVMTLLEHENARAMVLCSAAINIAATLISHN